MAIAKKNLFVILGEISLLSLFEKCNVIFVGKEIQN